MVSIVPHETDITYKSPRISKNNGISFEIWFIKSLKEDKILSASSAWWSVRNSKNNLTIFAGNFIEDALFRTLAIDMKTFENAL